MTQVELDLYYIHIQIDIPNFKSISQKTAEKIPENYIFAKSKYLSKSRSNTISLFH